MLKTQVNTLKQEGNDGPAVANLSLADFVV